MVEYHMARNKVDPDWCGEEVFKMATGNGADVLLLSDFRTRADVEFFKKKAAEGACSPHLVTLRVHASETARMERGWEADNKKDMLHTEVDLDDFVGWTACVDNSDNTETGARVLHKWVQHTVLARILT